MLISFRTSKKPSRARSRTSTSRSTKATSSRPTYLHSDFPPDRMFLLPTFRTTSPAQFFVTLSVGPHHQPARCSLCSTRWQIVSLVQKKKVFSRSRSKHTALHDISKKFLPHLFLRHQKSTRQFSSLKISHEKISPRTLKKKDFLISHPHSFLKN